MTMSQSELQNSISSSWWVILIQGIAAILLGILTFTNPGATITAWILYLGIYWIVNGILSIVYAISGKTNRSRFWQILGGILSMLAGIFALSQPLFATVVSTTFVISFIGISAIFGGFIQIFAGREVMDGAGFEWSWGSFFMGLLNIFFGIIILANPGFSAGIFLTVLAIWLIVMGIFLCVAAFRVRR